MESLLENPVLFDLYSSISAAEVERYFEHPEFASSDTTYTRVPQGPSAPRDEYHHYIPRFILKRFSDGLSTARGGPLINMYDVHSKELSLEFSGRSYGIKNMYMDVTAEDCMELEQILSKYESASATFINKINRGDEKLSLTRAKLAELKKFLVIMKYRNASRRRQYMLDRLDDSTRASVKMHMRHKNIKTLKEVWFENLKWLIKTPTEDIVNEYFSFLKLFKNYSNPEDATLAYRGPIHSTELGEFGNMFRFYVCIWEAEEGSEFIITDNCFGCFEGHGPIIFHNFFVISPKYAIVLVNRLEVDYGFMSKILRESWFEEFHLAPDCDYVKGDYKSACMDDVFKYKRIVIPKKKVYLVNSIFLDARHKSVTYKSKGSMYRTLKYYDEVKETMFHHRYDYSDLQRKLFDEINRTHST